MNAVIKVEQLSKIYQTDEVETTAVNNVSFEIANGEYVAITGPSGGGKSTMLSILGLLDSPSTGNYYFNGKNTVDMNQKDLCELRNSRIGFVFQSFNLIENLSVIQNVMLPLIYRQNISKKEIKDLAINALKQVDMDHRINHYPTQLSGGQQQRVAIARAMITDPSVILADEPTGNLDSKSADVVMELLKAQHEKGSTICIVTHDPRYTVDATRTINFADGSIVH